MRGIGVGVDGSDVSRRALKRQSMTPTHRSQVRKIDGVDPALKTGRAVRDLVTDILGESVAGKLGC
jgi:hypothetical protein